MKIRTKSVDSHADLQTAMHQRAGTGYWLVRKRHRFTTVSPAIQRLSKPKRGRPLSLAFRHVVLVCTATFRSLYTGCMKSNLFSWPTQPSVAFGLRRNGLPPLRALSAFACE
ncbi:uncharacterized protein ACO6RY_18429 [Pungitius sinensis]